MICLLFFVCSHFACPERNSAWITITFFGDSVKNVFDKETNETYTVEIPRLPIKALYPWDAMSGVPYFFSFVYQVGSLA